MLGLMTKFEVIIRFLAAELILALGALLAFAQFRYAYVFIFLASIALQPWSYTKRQYTRPIIGREALWTALATVMLIGALLAWVVFGQQLGNESSSAIWPAWLVAASWAFLCLVPVLWLLRSMRPNYSLKRTAANHHGVD